MKLVIAEAGEVRILEVPRPTCREGEVLVRTSFSAISTGTETWTVEATGPITTGDLMGDSSRLRKAIHQANDVRHKEGIGGMIDYVKAVRQPRAALGYSLSGKVVEVGKGVIDISVGDFVACVGEGKAAHGEFAAVPRNLVAKVPPGVDLQSAAFVALGAIGVHAFRQSGAQVGDTVAIVGAGLVGNLVSQICLASGCKVIATDTQSSRLELAKTVGVDLAVPTGDSRLQEQVSHLTKGRGVDAVIICASTASSDPVNLASKLLRDRGVVLIVGRVGMDFDRKLFYQKELDIRMSRSLGPGRYDRVYEEKGVDYPIGYVRWTLNRNMETFLELLSKKSLHLLELVERMVPVQEAAEAYKALKKSGKVAILLRYDSAVSAQDSPTFVTLNAEKAKGKVGVALVGPGGFARETLLPILRTENAFDLRWVLANNTVRAMEIGKRYHFGRYGTNLDDALRDEDTSLFVISTPNNLHYPMAVRVAKAGRIAFVEKPLCINEVELDDFVSSRSTLGTKVIVGFNRRYSPYVTKMRNTLSGMDGPFMINYRVNSDLAPLSRWSEDPVVGGGRVIHECCHFFDLFSYILGGGITSVSVIPTAINGSTAVSLDNFVATMRYSDGSVASLNYSSLGNRYAERERMEVFGQGTVMVLDNFERLTIYQKSGEKSIYSVGPDKGHRAEFRELVKLFKGEDNKLISFDEIVAAMRDTFLVDRNLRGAVVAAPDDESRGKNKK